jgi:hypothetical protein
VILILLIVLILLFASGGVYTGREGYAGPNVGGLLWVLCVVAIIVLFVQLLAGSLP